jgi:methylenetetrahydrofolate reductase (NADPH)
LLEKISTRKRPGRWVFARLFRITIRVDTVPHIICGGFNKEETENALIDLHFLGVDNVLVLQGDAIKSESKFVAEPDGHLVCIGIVGSGSKNEQGTLLG